MVPLVLELALVGRAWYHELSEVPLWTSWESACGLKRGLDLTFHARPFEA